MAYAEERSKQELTACMGAVLRVSQYRIAVPDDYYLLFGDY